MLTVATQCKLVVRKRDSCPHAAHMQPELAYAMFLRSVEAIIGPEFQQQLYVILWHKLSRIL